MIVLLSPTKTMDLSPPSIKEYSEAEMRDRAMTLVKIIRRQSLQSFKKLMKASDEIVKTNRNRFKSFVEDHNLSNSKQAIFSYDGAVYKAIDPGSLTSDQMKFAQKHVRILSGLYGILKPLDLIQPYRLEMATQLKNRKGSNLYAYWGSSITQSIHRDEVDQSNQLIINLSSNEYYKSIKEKELTSPIIHVNFKEMRNGVYKFITYDAKYARGLMTKYIVTHKITRKEELLKFDLDRYSYNLDLSSEHEYIFTR